MATFAVEYKKLNTVQRQAVNRIEGPVMVIAGPGTGKTQLLSMRVANILQKTDVYPDNILCLTFTNKAADNMAQRLNELIGKDARSVIVKTFHGLAADIMNRYPEYFWHGAKLSIAPDVIQLEIMQRVLYSLPADHPLSLKFAGQFTLINDVVSAIKLIKEAGLTPKKLQAMLEANLAYIEQIEPKFSKLGDLRVSTNNLNKIEAIVSHLPDQPIGHLIKPFMPLSTVIRDSFEQANLETAETTKTRPISKWKSRWLQKDGDKYAMSKERERTAWWLAVAEAYELYRLQLHKRGYYDYADMLVETISQVEQHPNLRASLQEQFQYVLIDEFQDTNAAQLRLAHLIADNPELVEPNIMAVGDDDQSIFKFQGAELSNMLGFTKSYPSVKVIVLTNNYRSSQAVLDSADKIIKTSNYRLVKRLPNLSKKLKAAGTLNAKSLIEHRTYPSRQEQLNNLADQTAKLFKSGKSVAVLARGHNSLRDMSMVLHQKSLPISYEQNNNILEQPAIEQLCLVLRILASLRTGQVSEVNELLSLTLRHPMWQIKPKTLWRFAIAQQTKYDWFTNLLNSKDKQLSNAGKWLNELAAVNASESLAVVIEYALGLRDSTTGINPIKTYFLDNEVTADYVQTLSAVQVLRSLVSEFRPYGRPKVEDFIQFIDLVNQNGKVIADQSPFVSKDRNIELLTVHSAKGLEFDVVIVIDAIHSEWSPKARGRIPPANLPLRQAEDDSDDYARLMYVAVTRAKNTVLIGSYLNNYKGETLQPAAPLGSLKAFKQPPASTKQVAQALELTLRWPRLEQKDEKALLKPRLESYSLNVTNLINFLDLTRGGPQYFKERNLLRLPQAKTASSSMGSAVHTALELAQLLVNSNKLKKELIVAKFEEELLNQGLPEREYRKKLAEGQRALLSFLDQHKWQFTKGATPEYKVVDTYLNQVRLGGTLDILDNTGEQTIISDYKTGRPLSSLNLKSGDEGVKAWRHKLQLIFYALLADLNPTIKIKGDLLCQMVYVQATKQKDLLLQCYPSKDELTELGSLVQAVWIKVMSLDLPDVSRYSPDLIGILQFQADLINNNI